MAHVDAPLATDAREARLGAHARSTQIAPQQSASNADDIWHPRIAANEAVQPFSISLRDCCHSA